MEHSKDSAHPYVVHQATGVLVAQFAISPEAALEKLEAMASDSFRPIANVAREVVDSCEQ